MTPVCLRLSIHGHVQGVYYRASLQAEALQLGLTGWVRNRRDGSVEAVVSGPDAAVEQLLAWARRGPPSARVERVSISVIDGRFFGFDVRPTA